MSSVALSGRTVAITGAARGIGFATARAAANAGAQVVIGDLDTAALAAAAEQIGRAHPVFLDVTSRESFAAFLDTAAQHSDGNLDVLINNAGIQHVGALVDATEADVHRQIEVNVGGTLTGLQLALARMVPRGRGHIINVSSAAGRTTLAHDGVYSATKAAIIALSEAADAETSGQGVQVSVILPGLVDTDMAAGAYQPPWLRMIAPEAVAAAILGVITRPRFQVWAPASTGWLYHAAAVLPRSARDTLMRMLRIDRTLIDVDWVVRADYEDRARAGGGAGLGAAGQEAATHAERTS